MKNQVKILKKNPTLLRTFVIQSAFIENVVFGNRLSHLTLNQGTFTPVGAGWGGGIRDPTVENHFPSEILQLNWKHICMHNKNFQFCS